MTRVKVVSNGDGLGVILPDEMIERLALHAGDELMATEVGGALTLVKEPALADRRREAIEHVLTNHARTLELLARR